MNTKKMQNRNASLSTSFKFLTHLSVQYCSHENAIAKLSRIYKNDIYQGGEKFLLVKIPTGRFICLTRNKKKNWGRNSTSLAEFKYPLMCIHKNRFHVRRCDRCYGHHYYDPDNRHTELCRQNF